jgi:hypothetical protein
MPHRAAAAASRALELALRGKHFQISDIQHGLTEPPSRQTIYRVLTQLEDDEWIQCSGKVWKPDLKATMLGDVDEGSGEKDGFSLNADELL